MSLKRQEEFCTQQKGTKYLQQQSNLNSDSKFYLNNFKKENQEGYDNNMQNHKSFKKSEDITELDVNQENVNFQIHSKKQEQQQYPAQQSLYNHDRTLQKSDSNQKMQANPSQYKVPRQIQDTKLKTNDETLSSSSSPQRKNQELKVKQFEKEILDNEKESKQQKLQEEDLTEDLQPLQQIENKKRNQNTWF